MVKPSAEAAQAKSPTTLRPVAEQTSARGVDLLRNPRYNRGMAFSEAEREQLGVRGLLPPRVLDIHTQEARIMETIRSSATDLDRYVQLMSLLSRNETLFFRTIIDHLVETMPLIYTPTVGEACQKYGHIFKSPRGLYVSYEDRGSVRKLLDNWPNDDVRVIVVTDGERILGLGDLGVCGAGIPIGKLLLYVACGGVEPSKTLPITLDVGTENHDLLSDPLYPGLARRRVRGDDYDAFIAEFVEAVKARFGENTLIQWEDFANANAFRLLKRWQSACCSFNDDIQGTAAVALGGVLGSLRMKSVESELRNHRFLFYGAGSAGLGIADLIVSFMVSSGQVGSVHEARRHCWFVDSKGLIYKGRGMVTEEKSRFAHAVAPDELKQVGSDSSGKLGVSSADDAPQRCISLEEAVRLLRPTALLGVSTIPKSFTREIIEFMCSYVERPIVFALSNPTSKSECTAQEAYAFSGGKAVFASGSPFEPVALTCADGVERTFAPGQANNSYCFPGCGAGVVIAGATRFTEEMFLEAANAVAAMTSEQDLASGSVFPPLTQIREVSARIGMAVANEAVRAGVNTLRGSGAGGKFTIEDVRAQQYDPAY